MKKTILFTILFLNISLLSKAQTDSLKQKTKLNCSISLTSFYRSSLEFGIGYNISDKFNLSVTSVVISKNKNEIFSQIAYSLDGKGLNANLKYNFSDKSNFKPYSSIQVGFSKIDVSYRDEIFVQTTIDNFVFWELQEANITTKVNRLFYGALVGVNKQILDKFSIDTEIGIIQRYKNIEPISDIQIASGIREPNHPLMNDGTTVQFNLRLNYHF